jgi:hypothetical protein
MRSTWAFWTSLLRLAILESLKTLLNVGEHRYLFLQGKEDKDAACFENTLDNPQSVLSFSSFLEEGTDL